MVHKTVKNVAVFVSENESTVVNISENLIQNLVLFSILDILKGIISSNLLG